MDPLALVCGLLEEKVDEEKQESHADVIKLASELLDREQPALLEGALEALDRAPVRLIVTKEYKRALHVVKGRDKLEYTILDQRDCTCQSFQQNQYRSLHPKCKHLLAVRLAPHLGRLEIQHVNDDQYATYCSLHPS